MIYDHGHQRTSFPGLLTPAFVACSSTASDKRWGEKAEEELGTCVQ